MSLQSRRVITFCGVTASFLALCGFTVHADVIYWDNELSATPGVWNTDPTNWNTAADGSGVNPAATPGSADIASFNVSTLNTAQTISIQTNQVLDGINFTSTGDVLLQSNSNSRTVTIGAGGITKTGTTGVSTVSPSTSGIRFATLLSAPQTWSNDATDPAGTLLVRSGANGLLQFSNPGVQTLTLAGSNTGLNAINTVLGNGGFGATMSVVKNGPGTWAYTAGASASYTGGLTINEGVFVHGFTTNASGLGTGTLTLNGGELRGGQSNMTVANPIHVTANSAISPVRYDLLTGLTIVNYNSAFTSSGTPGNGPVLTFNIPTGVNSPTVGIAGAATGDISGFNGTFRINQIGATGRAINIGGTTPTSANGENAIFELNGPNNSPIGVFGNRIQVLGASADVPVFKMGELRGSAVLALNSAANLGVQTLEVGHLGTNSVFSGDIKQFQTLASTTMRLNKVGTGSLTLSGSNDYMGGTLVSGGTLIAGVDAPVSKFLPTDAVAQNVNITSSVFTTNSTAASSPTPHGLADGDRIIAQANLNAADAATLLNVPLYVKVLTPETFALYTDPALTTQQTFTDTAAFTTRIVMPSAFGSGATAIELGTGTDGNSVGILAGTGTTPTITFARDVHVAANSGGTSAIGSGVDGNSVFSGAISLDKDLQLTSASTGSNSLVVSGLVSSSGAFGLTKVGAGRATLTANNTYSGSTNVNEGTLLIDGNYTGNGAYTVASGATLIANNVRTSSLTVSGTTEIRADGGTAGASKVETLTINTGGQLNLKNNDLVVGTAADLFGVRSQIKLGRIGMADNVAGASGITSDMMTVSTHGFGYAAGNDPRLSPLVSGPQMLSGQTFDADSVLVKYTYRGDADLDGDSDLDDLGHWANSFTGDLGLGPVAAPTTLWTQGDWDYDGDTDLDDLGFWSSTFTGDLGGGGLSVYAPNAPEGAISALAGMGITAVPEPGSGLLISIGVIVFGLRSARRRTKEGRRMGKS